MKAEIEIKKGEQYIKTANKLSEVISALHLSADDNNKLIAVILEHTEAGRAEAYAQGVADAINTDLLQQLAEYEEESEAAIKRLEISH